MRKTISIILSVLMILSSFSIITTISAKETNVASTGAANSGTTGDCTWSFDESTATLTISGNGDMNSNDWYEPSDVPWYIYSFLIKTLVIEDGVTSVGGCAFYGCSKLTSITIPDSVISIGYYAFYGCSSLTSITIPNSVTSIGNYAFYNCSSLTSIEIPDSVTSISEYAFYGTAYYNDENNWVNGILYINNNLIKAKKYIEKCAIKNGTKVIANNAFGSCSSLISVTIPDSVTSIGDSAFENCSSLTSITIPDSITSIGRDAFYKTAYYGNENNWDNGLLYINNYLVNAENDIEKCVVKDGTKLIAGGAFKYCSKLTSITIPNSVTTIGSSAFSCCSSLTSITIPNSVTSIGSSAFENCSSIKDVYYSGNKRQWKLANKNNDDDLKNATIHYGSTTDSGTIGGCTWSIDGDTGILNISGNGDMPSYSDTDDIPWYVYRESITKVNIEDGVTSIGMGDFYNCPNLTNVSIPDSVKTIGKNSFAYCSNLVDISLPDNLECIVEGAFYDTGYYKDENNWKNGVLYIGKYLIVANNVGKNCIIKDGTRLIANSAFAVQRNLARIAMPDTLEIIGESAFSDCTNLAGVSIPNSVKVIGTMAFNNCTGLESIVIPSNVETIGEEAFSGCSGLTGVAISEGVKNIGKSAFKSCSIKNLTIPSSMETIGESAFASNILVNVVILEGITSINNSVFYQCTSLESIDIPVSVKSIGESAFAACRSLSTVNYFGNKKQWSLITVEKNNDKLKDANIQYGLLTDSGETGDCQWAFDGETGTMTITGNGKMEDYEDSANVPWILYASDIKTVIIDDGVTKIGDFSFADNCKNITDVTIANTVTDIGLWAFDGCDSIENVYYKGLENQWNTVKIRDYNDSIVNANIHFADEHVTEPTTTKPTVKKVAKVTVNKKSVVLVKGRTTTVKATVSPTNASNKKLKWTTSNSKVAVVNSQGKITAKGRGNATIKVMALDGSNKYATVKVTVKQPVTSVKLNKKSATLKVKGNAKQKTVTLKATVNPKNANNKAVTWKSSKSKIATVNSKGKVIAKKRGTCYITATAKDGSKKSAKCKVVVK